MKKMGNGNSAVSMPKKNTEPKKPYGLMEGEQERVAKPNDPNGSIAS